ncbi:MAG: Gfo/Idh/MocA family oxidoreductase [Armatimonadetes bacterium]|nr:Gfo/Idh/MocA family oxidoreductase [Armatimonadota bacterium]
MSKTQVGLGLIGCGQISEWHLRETQSDPRVRWVAACDLRPEAVAARADEFGIPGRYTEVEALLADPAVDAVLVATSPVAHVGPTVAAFRAGKHVLVEKPVALDAGEVEAMLAAQGDRIGACCSCRFRSTPSAARVAESIARGGLGRLRRLVCRVTSPAPETFDGTQPFFLHRPGWGGQGILADWGCYDLDYLLGLNGWPAATEVVAEMRRLPAAYRRIAEPVNDVELQVSALVRLAGGATLDYRRAAFYAGEARAQWRMEFEEGALELNMLPGAPQAMLHRLSATGVRSEVLVEEADTWSDVHAGPVADFLGAITDGRKPLTSLEDALVVQRVTDAVYAAAGG